MHSQNGIWGIFDGIIEGTICITRQSTRSSTNDAEIRKVRSKIKSIETPFLIRDDDMIVMRRRIYFLKDITLKEEVLKKAHESWFVVHPESTKMYKDLKEFYWWLSMKKEIAEFVSKYGICQQVKVEH